MHQQGQAAFDGPVCQSGPMRISEEIELPVEAAEAWRVLLAWEDQAEWMKDASWVRVRSPQREGVGTKIAVKTLLFGIPAFVEPMEVIAWDPPHSLRMRHGSLVKGTGEWRLEPGEAGSVDRCRFTWTEDIQLNVPVVGELAAKIYSRFMRHLMRGSLADLRRYLQGHEHQG